MEKKNKYYVVRDKALPEVLQKVVEVKRLLETDKNMTVQEAAEQVGLSRSSFYKYKDDILPFSDNTRGKTVTLVTQMIDEPGLLSDLLHIVADYRANILTIHQTIPVNGNATVTLSVEVLSDTGNMAGFVPPMVSTTIPISGSFTICSTSWITSFSTGLPGNSLRSRIYFTSIGSLAFFSTLLQFLSRTSYTPEPMVPYPIIAAFIRLFLHS